MSSYFTLSAGSHHSETTNNPLEKETGAVHGPEPSMFVFGFFLVLSPLLKVSMKSSFKSSYPVPREIQLMFTCVN